MAEYVYTSLYQPGRNGFQRFWKIILFIIVLSFLAFGSVFILHKNKALSKRNAEFNEKDATIDTNYLNGLESEFEALTDRQEIVASKEKIDILVQKYEEIGLEVQTTTYEVLLYFPDLDHPSSLSVLESNDPCEPLRVDKCKSFGYNHTVKSKPEFNQADASDAIESLDSLMRFQCSPYTQAFLCAFYAPDCNAPRPCRSVCVSVKSACYHVWDDFGYQWPRTLDCKSLPTDECLEAHQLPGVDDTTSAKAPTTVTVTETVPYGCEPNRVPMCSELNNMTRLPNYLNHADQESAGLELHQYWPLVEIACSIDLQPFLCSLYSPACGAPLPCRSLCESARNGCAPLMNKYGFEWPGSLDCSNFAQHQCITVTRPTTVITTTTVGPTFEGLYPATISKTAGETVEMTCKVNDIGTRNLVWRKDQIDIDPDDRIRTIVLTNSPSIYESRLVIKRVTRGDAGRYSCTLVYTYPAKEIIMYLSVTDEHAPPVHSSTAAALPTPVSSTCETITVSHCEGIGYNDTRLPNSLGHVNQRQAELGLASFTPLIQYNCYPHLRTFLCSVYLPFCSHLISASIPPCRSFCEDARTSCEPVLREFGFSWPEKLDCELFPEKDKGGLCVEKTDDGIRNKRELDDPWVSITSERDKVLWFPYSASMTFEGPLVYVNHGTEDDYNYLKRHDISVENSIFLMHIVNPPIKAVSELINDAYDKGAQAVIAFCLHSRLPDPSVRSLYGGLGDPLTPHSASTFGTERLAQSARVLPKIGVMGVSRETVNFIFATMDGSRAPAQYDGYGNFRLNSHKTYKIEVRGWNKRANITNVFAYLKGNQPKKDMLHFSSPMHSPKALAAQLSISKTLTKTNDSNMNAVFSDWDAEIYNSIGQTEWFQDNQHSLLNETITVVEFKHIHATYNYCTPIYTRDPIALGMVSNVSGSTDQFIGLKEPGLMESMRTITPTVHAGLDCVQKTTEQFAKEMLEIGLRLFNRTPASNNFQLYITKITEAARKTDLYLSSYSKYRAQLGHLQQLSEQLSNVAQRLPNKEKNYYEPLLRRCFQNSLSPSKIVWNALKKRVTRDQITRWLLALQCTISTLQDYC